MEMLGPIGVFTAMFVLAAAILMVRDRLFGPRSLSPAEQRAAQTAWEARVLAPDWAAVERQLGRTVPTALRELYADHALLRSAPFTVHEPLGADDAEWDVNDFQPADGRGDHFWIPPGAFCFATTSFGDPYFVQFAAGGEDGPISVHYHDGGAIVRVADSLAQFLSWPRQPDRARPDAEA